ERKMFVRSIFSNYYRLLAGALLAALAITLAGCNDQVVEKVAPSRPVLVATVHYESESPERSFVGTIKPRIETDMGFRVPGKAAKRLVEVGQTVAVPPPLSSAPRICASKAGPPTRSWIRPRPRLTKHVRVSIVPSARSNSPGTPC